jgi:hypothetical protein
MRPLKLSLMLILKKLASLLSPARRGDAASIDAEELKKRIEAGYKRNPSDPQTDRLSSVTRPIIQIPDSVLEEYRANQEQQHTDNKKTRNIAIWAVLGAWLYAGIAAVQWVEMRRSNTLAVRTAEQARKAAEDTLKKIEENSQLDQRAWVGVIGTNMPNIKPNSKFTIEVTFTNTGKTPALKFTSIVAIKGFRNDETFRPIYDKPVNPKPSNLIIYPGMRIALPTIPIELTQTQIDILKSGLQIYRVYGKFSYDDIFKRHWGGTFCMFLQPDLTTMSWCDTYNEGRLCCS